MNKIIVRMTYSGKIFTATGVPFAHSNERAATLPVVMPLTRFIATNRDFSKTLNVRLESMKSLLAM